MRGTHSERGVVLPMVLLVVVVLAILLAAGFAGLSSERRVHANDEAALDAFPGSPESMAALLKTETERWGRYVKLAKIEPQ